MSRKTTEQMIAEEEKKAEQAKARMAELKAKQRAEARRKDTHRKVVSGAILMAHIKIDPQFRRSVQVAFNKAVTNPKLRAVLADLLDERAFQEAQRAAEEEAAAECIGEVTPQSVPPEPPSRPHRPGAVPARPNGPSQT